MKIKLLNLKRIIREELARNLNEMYDQCPCGIDRSMCDYHKDNVSNMDASSWNPSDWVDLQKLNATRPEDNEYDEDEIMTANMAIKLCKKIGLNQRVIDHITDEFDQIEHGSYTPAVGEYGRAAFGQSWEHVLGDLAEAMGHPLGEEFPWSDEGNDPSHPINKVYDLFFEE